MKKKKRWYDIIKVSNENESKQLQSLLFQCGWKWSDKSSEVLIFNMPADQEIMFFLKDFDYTFSTRWHKKGLAFNQNTIIEFYRNYDRIREDLDIIVLGEDIFI